MESRWCNACGSAFTPRPQAPRQSYCTEPQCQKERRRLWQQAKRRSDPDYLSNQARANRAWAERNPDYWQRYREEHTTYTQTNRQKQRERNGRAVPLQFDGDAAALESPPSGLYEIRRLDGEPGRKMDVWIVQITALPDRNGAPRVTK